MKLCHEIDSTRLQKDWAIRECMAKRSEERNVDRMFQIQLEQDEGLMHE